MRAGWLACCGILLLAGCHGVGRREALPVAPVARFGFFLESRETGATELTLPQSGVRVSVAASPLIAPDEVSGVDVAVQELGRALQFRLSEAGVRRLREAAAANAGRRLILVVDDRALGVKRLGSGSADDLTIFVEVADVELSGLATALKSSIAAMHQKR